MLSPAKKPSAYQSDEAVTGTGVERSQLEIAFWLAIIGWELPRQDWVELVRLWVGKTGGGVTSSGPFSANRKRLHSDADRQRRVQASGTLLIYT